MPAEKPLLTARPSWWNYFWYPILTLVILVILLTWLDDWMPLKWWSYIAFIYPAIILITLLIGYIQRQTLKLRVYADRVALERGLLSKHHTSVFIKDVRSIDTKQGPLERLLGVGDVLIGSAGVSGHEIMANNIANPRKVNDLLLDLRRKASGNPV